MAIRPDTSFYLKNRVKTWLAEQAEVNAYTMQDGDSIVLELIDRPYRCWVQCAYDTVSVKLYIRSELGMYDPMRGDVNVTMFPGGGEPMVRDSGRIDKGYELALELHKAACALRAILADADLSNVDSELEGVSLKQGEEALEWRVVKGKKRPSLLCTTLFEGDKPVRPYTDEIRGAWQQTEKDLATLLAEAEQGDEDAMDQVARSYLREEDYANAVLWLERLSTVEDAAAQFRLGMMHLLGTGVQRNMEAALQWMQRAEYNDHSEAERYVCLFETIVALEARAKAGELAAMAQLAEEYLNLGCSLEDGEVLFSVCLDYARAAAEQDVPAAIWVLARCYEQGCGVDEDTELALQYYGRGCDLGHSGCMHAMGCFYLRGDYLVSDPQRGIELCTRAAELGYGPAMLTMGDCYQFGDSVEPSMKMAVQWYEAYLENHEDAELAHQVMHFKSIPGLVDDTGMAMPFEMELEEKDPVGGVSIFGDDPFSAGGMSLMNFGGDAISLTGEMFSEPVVNEPSVSMFSDDLIWTRLRAEAGDEEAIALLAALGETAEYDLEFDFD